MLMVIFGAGASFDSVNLQKAPIDDRSYQPPLARTSSIRVFIGRLKRSRT